MAVRPPAIFYEPGSDRNYPIIVQDWLTDIASSLDAIGHIDRWLQQPTRPAVRRYPFPLSAIADIRPGLGWRRSSYREHQERYIPIKFSACAGVGPGRCGPGGAGAHRAKTFACSRRLPPGMGLASLASCRKRLGRLGPSPIPISPAPIAMLLYINFSSLRDTLLAASVMPMAAIGGVLSLYSSPVPPFSVSGRDWVHRSVRHLGHERNYRAGLSTTGF